MSTDEREESWADDDDCVRDVRISSVVDMTEEADVGRPGMEGVSLLDAVEDEGDCGGLEGPARNSSTRVRDSGGRGISSFVTGTSGGGGWNMGL